MVQLEKLHMIPKGVGQRSSEVFDLLVKERKSLYPLTWDVLSLNLKTMMLENVAFVTLTSLESNVILVSLTFLVIDSAYFHGTSLSPHRDEFSRYLHKIILV